MTTGICLSMSRPLRYRAARTATFIVLAASWETSALRSTTGARPQGATTIDSIPAAYPPPVRPALIRRALVLQRCLY
ncbi:hypothetical protein T261_08287 [Streptomyces lydicus]|nr:hypothetical protein T261_08287 [Streptomyces lydicus]